MACFYRRTGKIRTALNYMLSALNIELKSDNFNSIADTHLNLCAVLSELDRHDEALEHGLLSVVMLQDEVLQHTLKQFRVNESNNSKLKYDASSRVDTFECHTCKQVQFVSVLKGNESAALINDASDVLGPILHNHINNYDVDKNQQSPTTIRNTNLSPSSTIQNQINSPRQLQKILKPTKGDSIENRMAVLVIAYHNLGVEFEHLKRQDEAIRIFNKAYQFSKDYLSQNKQLVANMKKVKISAQNSQQKQKQVDKPCYKDIDRIDIHSRQANKKLPRVRLADKFNQSGAFLGSSPKNSFVEQDENRYQTPAKEKLQIEQEIFRAIQRDENRIKDNSSELKNLSVHQQEVMDLQQQLEMKNIILKSYENEKLVSRKCGRSSAQRSLKKKSPRVIANPMTPNSLGTSQIPKHSIKIDLLVSDQQSLKKLDKSSLTYSDKKNIRNKFIFPKEIGSAYSPTAIGGENVQLNSKRSKRNSSVGQPYEETNNRNLFSRLRNGRSSHNQNDDCRQCYDDNPYHQSYTNKPQSRQRSLFNTKTNFTQESHDEI